MKRIILNTIVLTFLFPSLNIWAVREPSPVIAKWQSNLNYKKIVVGSEVDLVLTIKSETDLKSVLASVKITDGLRLIKGKTEMFWQNVRRADSFKIKLRIRVIAPFVQSVVVNIQTKNLFDHDVEDSYLWVLQQDALEKSVLEKSGRVVE